MICSVVFAILSVRLDLSVVQDSALFALGAGFAGGLSTVSTWVGEIHKLNALEPWRARGHLYATASLAISLVIGIIGYGTAVWSL